MHGLWACLLQSRYKVTSWLTCHVMSLQVSISKDNGFLVIRIGFHKAAVTAFFQQSVFHSRWGKERPLNSRLLMQDICLPDYDFSPMSHLPDNEAWNVQVFRSITSDAARLVSSPLACACLVSRIAMQMSSSVVQGSAKRRVLGCVNSPSRPEGLGRRDSRNPGPTF